MFFAFPHLFCDEIMQASIFSVIIKIPYILWNAFSYMNPNPDLKDEI